VPGERTKEQQQEKVQTKQTLTKARCASVCVTAFFLRAAKAFSLRLDLAGSRACGRHRGQLARPPHKHKLPALAPSK